MEKFNVLGTEITYYKKNNQDYISLTDMLKAKDGDFFMVQESIKHFPNH